jgi:hypothetical protein
MRNISLCRKRLKLVFEGRKQQLELERQKPWPPTDKDKRDYGRAVTAYVRARTAWRKIRGWQ